MFTIFIYNLRRDNVFDIQYVKPVKSPDRFKPCDNNIMELTEVSS